MIDPRTREMLDQLFGRFNLCRCDDDGCASCRRIAGARKNEEHRPITPPARRLPAGDLTMCPICKLVAFIVANARASARLDYLVVLQVRHRCIALGPDARLSQ